MMSAARSSTLMATLIAISLKISSIRDPLPIVVLVPRASQFKQTNSSFRFRPRVLEREARHMFMTLAGLKEAGFPVIRAVVNQQVPIHELAGPLQMVHYDRAFGRYSFRYDCFSRRPLSLSRSFHFSS